MSQTYSLSSIYRTISLLFAITFVMPSFAENSKSTAITESDSIYKQINLSDVYISSGKVYGKLSELPVSITTLSSTDLKMRNVTNIKDFSLMVPNLFMPDYGTKLTSPVYIRGIGSRINSPSVGLYVDGIPYFEKSTFDFDFADIASIEVLRGPQGTIFGRNTMGGIINVTTHSPVNYEGTHINLSAGNYGQVQTSLSHYGKFNSKWGYSVTGNYIHHNGFFTNKFDNKKADKLNSGGGRIRLAYQHKGVDLSIVSGYEYSDQSGYPYMKVDTASHKPTEVNYNGDSFYRRELSSNGVILNVTRDHFIFTSRTAYQYYKGHQGIDQDFSPASLYYINQKETQHMISQELEFKNNHEGRFNWIAGLFGFYQGLDKQVKMDNLADAKPVQIANTTTDKYYDNPSYGASVFAQASVKDILIPNLTLTAGARLDLEYSDLKYTFYKISAKGTSLADEFKHSLKHTQISPKFALQYQIRKKQNIYATVTKGYKAGGFNTSFATKEERSFKPEDSWNYELGTKLSFAEGRFITDLTLFYIDWNNQQIYQPLSTGKGSLLKNAGKSVSKGVEWSGNWQIIPGLNLQGSYGYTHATFKKYTNKDKDYAGNFLPYVPEHTIAGNINYTYYTKDIKWFNRIYLSLQYNGVGPLYWNDNNSMKQDFYNTLAARAAISKDRLTVALWAKNLTGSDFSAFYFEALGNSYIQKGRPRTFGVDISFSF
ncbi:MAG: TonB-dependent receptor [Bacteroidales bacterium]